MSLVQNERKKRKRNVNTSREQIEIFVNELENDPALGENYTLERWEILKEKLNSVPHGPHLSVEEWKKRFTDWKYMTNSKFRKIKHRKLTGSGPEYSIAFTDMEFKALSLWGKITSEDEDLKDYKYIPPTITRIRPKERRRHFQTQPKPLSGLMEQMLDANLQSNNSFQQLANVLEIFSEKYIEIKQQEIDMQREIKQQELDIERAKIQIEVEKIRRTNPYFNLDI